MTEAEQDEAVRQAEKRLAEVEAAEVSAINNKKRLLDALAEAAMKYADAESRAAIAHLRVLSARHDLLKSQSKVFAEGVTDGSKVLAMQEQ